MQDFQALCTVLNLETQQLFFQSVLYDFTCFLENSAFWANVIVVVVVIVKFVIFRSDFDEHASEFHDILKIIMSPKTIFAFFRENILQSNEFFGKNILALF